MYILGDVPEARRGIATVVGYYLIVSNVVVCLVMFLRVRNSIVEIISCRSVGGIACLGANVRTLRVGDYIV